MPSLETMLLLFAAVVVLAAAARVAGVAYPVLLVLGGLGIGFVPGAPSPELDPDVIFYGFLPPLLYSAGRHRPRASARPRTPGVAPVALLTRRAQP